MSQDSIIIYRDIRDAIMQLPPELCKQVLDTVFNYAFDDIEPAPDTEPIVLAFFIAFRSRFDMDVLRRETQQNNGKKGGNPNFVKGKRNPYYEDNPKITEDNPRITEDNPRITEDNPRITEDNPKITEDNPKITEDNPKITEDNPKITEDNPRITEDNPKITEDNPRITEDNPKITERLPKDNLISISNNTSVVDVVVDKCAHTRESENEKFLEEFFAENKRAQVEILCMQLKTTPQQLQEDAREVIAEWELTDTTHDNYKEQAQHLINQLRIKNNAKLREASNGTASRKQTGATAYKGGYSEICTDTPPKKRRKSTI